MSDENKVFKKEAKVFREHGGILSTSEAIQSGIHPRNLYAMRDAHHVEQLSRGLYRLAEMSPMENPDFVVVGRRVPGGVLCLLSALYYYGLTTQIPHEIHVALRMGARPPRLDHPPVRFYHFSGKAFSEGIVEREVDGIRFKIYSREKTLADCFKHRNTIGMDTVLEALRNYWQGKDRKMDDLNKYSAICRVTRVMKPYLESVQS